MKLKLICLVLAVMLLFSACGSETPGPRPSVPVPDLMGVGQTEPEKLPQETDPVTEPQPQETQPQETEPEKTEPADPGTEPQGGEEPVEAFGLRAGTLIATATGVYSAEDRGIYRWENGEAELAFDPQWDYYRNIASDGESVCYVDDHGYLVQVDLETGTLVNSFGPFEGDAYIVGAVGTVIYVDCWNDESDWAPDTYRVDLSNGIYDELDQAYDVHNQEGFLVIREYATDVSPRRTWIYAPDGEEILSGVLAWRDGISDGMIWISATDSDYGTDYKYMDTGLHIYAYVGDGWVSLVERQLDGTEYYGGNCLGGFYTAFSNEGLDAWTVGTDEAVPAEMQEVVDHAFSRFYWNGQEYYVGGGYLYEITEQGELRCLINPEQYGYWYDYVLFDALYIGTQYGTVAINLD